ncbi:MAG: hypothetical protein HC875_34380, partial [Anaerolineales bacterium]|nr:hypothetical protein [Anaerolineales bacterium]
MIAVFSAPFILVSAGGVRWPHLAIPFILASGNLLSLLDLNTPAWLVHLLAMSFFISAIHGESILTFRQKYTE